MQCGAVLCCTYWVRCWDCIAWDSCSGAYRARLLLTWFWVGSEENREIVQVQHNTMWTGTRMESMHPLFGWWCLMFASSSHDGGHSCCIGKPMHSPHSIPRTARLLCTCRPVLLVDVSDRDMQTQSFSPAPNVTETCPLYTAHQDLFL